MTIETFTPSALEDIEVMVNDKDEDIGQLWVFHNDIYLGSILPKVKGVTISYADACETVTCEAVTCKAGTCEAVTCEAEANVDEAPVKITAVNILLYKSNDEQGNTLLTQVPITIRSDELWQYTFYYL